MFLTSMVQTHVILLFVLFLADAREHTNLSFSSS